MNTIILDKQWQKSLPNNTESQWLEIFPEAREYIKSKIETNLKLQEYLGDKIVKRLENIKKNPSKWDWLRKMFVKTFLGDDLDKLEKESKKLVWLIKPTEEKKGTEDITPMMIDIAKNYPLSQLIITNKGGFAKCHLHEEKHPSLYTKKNFWHCFSCQTSGDTIAYLQQASGMSFPEAVKYLD